MLDQQELPRCRSRSRSPPPLLPSLSVRVQKHRGRGRGSGLNRGPTLPGVLHLSHIVYEVDSLRSACDVFEAITGVRPVAGSRHEGFGLQNAIVGLGDGRYLEFLAKGPPMPPEGIAAPVVMLGNSTDKPRITGWGCDARDVGLTALVMKLAQMPLRSIVPCEVTLMHRKLHGQERLIWRVAADKHRDRSAAPPMGGLVPFLVDWLGSLHNRPGLTAPSGCELVSLKAMHPEAADVRSVLRAMRADHLLDLEQGLVPRISAVIKHPHGQLVLE